MRDLELRELHVPGARPTSHRCLASAMSLKLLCLAFKFIAFPSETRTHRGPTHGLHASATISSYHRVEPTCTRLGCTLHPAYNPLVQLDVSPMLPPPSPRGPPPHPPTHPPTVISLPSDHESKHKHHRPPGLRVHPSTIRRRGYMPGGLSHGVHNWPGMAVGGRDGCLQPELRRCELWALE